MSARTKRMERIVELRARAVDLAAGELARARLAAEAAAARMTELARAHGEAADEAARLRSGTIAEFSDRRAFVDSLREGLERARVEVRKADAVLEEKQRGVAEAKRELRKIEIWRDGLLQGERDDDARKERAATDELAARVTRITEAEVES
jgi:flagellar export protein FliJ